MTNSIHDKSPDRIAGMFDAIAPRYDLLNRILSAGIDRRWRARAIAALDLTGRESLLDVCSGTADVALEGCRRGAAQVVGIDFSAAMLGLGLAKIRAADLRHRVTLVRGDAARLPVASGSVDAVTAAFGIRNVQCPEVACEEMARVLKPGGRLAILEFGSPRVPGLRAVYKWYFSRVLPLVGRLLSGHHVAYSYLPESVGAFPPPAAFCEMLRQAGVAEVRANPLTLGIVYLYTGVKPR